MWRKRVCGVLAGAFMLVCPGVADATLFVTADATGDKGYINLTAVGNTNLTNLSLGEVNKDGSYGYITTPTLYSFGTFPQYGELGSYTLRRATTWRCDQQTRTFAVYGTDPDGTVESNTFTVRTPSCAHRFSIEFPPEVRPGSRVKVFLRDTFEVGGTSATLCRRSPAELGPRCKRIAFAPFQPVTRSVFNVTKRGRWTVALNAPNQHIHRVLNVGVKPRPEDLAKLPSIVTTGDSLMQGPDALLEDRLDLRAVVHSDVHIGSGLTKDLIVDFGKLPARQVREFHPDATLLFLGTNDDSPIQPPGSDYISCCGDDWIAEYVRRAKVAMQQYTARGGSLFWLTIPLPKDLYRQKNVLAVNAALIEAAQDMPRVHLIDMASLFTPNNVYRDSMQYEGRNVRVRQTDGVHLTVAGSQIADTAMIQAMEQYGIL